MRVDSAPLAEIRYEDLQFFERLGVGSFGTVYKAKWTPNGEVVAVKRVLVLEKEAFILSVLNHRNIIRFFGAVTKSPNFCIVTEFASRGSLHDYLFDSANADISVELLLRWTRDIAAGMQYLHDETPYKIIHRDLKSKNIVISEDNICKLCDFGTSKPISHTTQMSQVGTVAYMSVEMIRSLPVSNSTDVWSFGVVLWELLTRQTPFHGFSEFRVSYMVAEEGVRLTIPSACPKAFAVLMKECWNVTANNRPTFKEILRRVEEMQESSSLTKETQSFLQSSVTWKREISQELQRLKSREKDLGDKEMRLKDWERKLAKREQTLENSRKLKRQISYDVNAWSELEVVNWLEEIARESVSAKALAIVSECFHRNHINGQRLLLLTDSDLQNLGVTSLGHRKHFLDERDRLDINNQRLINFPPLSHAMQQSPSTGAGSLGGTPSPRSRSGSLKEAASSVISITLCFGFYCRESASTSPEFVTVKWKPFVDVDDAESDDPYAYIKDVTFASPIPPFEVHRVSHAPYVYPKWTISSMATTSALTPEALDSPNGNEPRLPDNASDYRNVFIANGASTSIERMVAEELVDVSEIMEVKCVVSYTDSVRKPRNTNHNLKVAWSHRGLVSEKVVNLTVKVPLTPKVAVNVANANLSPSFTGSLRSASSASSLKGAWQTKIFHDSVPSLPETPKTKRSSLWADVTAGLRNSATTPSLTDSVPRKLSVPGTSSEQASLVRLARLPPSPQYASRRPTVDLITEVVDGLAEEHEEEEADGPVATLRYDSDASTISSLAPLQKSRNSEGLLLLPFESSSALSGRHDIKRSRSAEAIKQTAGASSDKDRNSGFVAAVNSSLRRKSPSPRQSFSKKSQGRRIKSAQPSEDYFPAAVAEQPPECAAVDKKAQGSACSAAVYGGNMKWTWLQGKAKRQL